MKENRLTYGKDPGYQIPPGYLENLEDSIMARIDSSQPSLQFSEKAEKVFTVPENYFQSFEERLFTKLPAPRKEPKIISLLNKEAFYYVAGVAAVFVAIVVNTFTQQPEPLGMDSLDMLSLETYIDETIDHSTPEATRMFSEGTFSYAPSGPSSNIDQEALLEYLQENIEEPSLIFNED